MTWSKEICRMSKIFNFEFLTPLFDNLKMLHFDTNPIHIGYLVTELWVIYQYWKQYKTHDFTSFFANILKTISATSDWFLWIMSLHNVNCKINAFISRGKTRKKNLLHIDEWLVSFLRKKGWGEKKSKYHHEERELIWVRE